MRKLVLFYLLIPINILVSQTQIGNDIDGNNAGDQLGWSTAISNDGTIVAIGAPKADNEKGYVKVLKNINGSWTQIGNDILGEKIGGNFGQSIALSDDGTILAAGAHLVSDNSYNITTGIVKVYKLENNSWVQLGNVINGGDVERNQTGIPQENIEFGYAISLNANGTTIAIGAPKADLTCMSCNWVLNCGQTRIYEFENNDWGIKKIIYGENEEDNSGNSVSLSSNGRTLAIGAYNNDGNGNNSGHVRIYKKIGNDWQLSGENGNKDINGENSYDLSGFSVSLSGNENYVAIGAPANDGNDGNSIDSGHTKVYFYEGNNDQLDGRWFSFWGDIDGESTVDQFGYSVSISENGLYLAVGSIDNDGNGSKSGHVRIYKIGTRIDQKGIDINGEASGDQAGFSVSISGDGTKVAIGAPFNDGNGSNSGHVRVFELSAILSTTTFSNSNFTIYPNPAKSQVELNIKENIILKEVTISNNLGQIVTKSQNKTIDVSNLQSGIYLLTITTNQGKLTNKLIIN